MKVFVEELYAGMEITESEWYRDFEIEDPDDQDPKDRIFEIVADSLEVSHPSLESLEDPFSAIANGEKALIVVKMHLQIFYVASFYFRCQRSQDCGQFPAHK